MSTRAVDARLQEWAKWYLGKINVGNLQCNLGRVIEYGPAAGHQGVAHDPEVPQHVATVEKAVTRLCQIDQRVIKSYYGRSGDPVEQLAARMRMSVNHFRKVLNRARWRVEGYIAAFE